VPSSPEAHRLGPHVVGTRVVVRRLLPGERGPSGGPAMTDVLGTCLRWSDGECVVQPEDGPAVTIPVDTIVSGKPVPPRASVRQRASALEVERQSFVLWPAMVTEPLGEWVLRTAPPVDGRRLRRANSVLAMGDPGVPLAAAADRVRVFYAEQHREPMAMVAVGSEVEAGLVDLGWHGEGLPSAHAQLAAVPQALRTARAAAPPDEPEILAEDDERVEVALPGRARGRAAARGDWVGVHGVVVDPAHRRQGLATAVVAALLEWGAERGTRTAWLHVETDNPPGIALYAGLGFRTHHTYRYLVPATS
jgi:N-acetylglutamate synthase